MADLVLERKTCSRWSFVCYSAPVKLCVQQKLVHAKSVVGLYSEQTSQQVLNYGLVAGRCSYTLGNDISDKS